MIKDRLTIARKALAARGIDYYLIPTADSHLSEYVPAHFAFRSWLSGFTGSAGTLLVAKRRALLWADGRYFIQAAKQLRGSGVELMRMGDAGVPTISEFLGAALRKGQVLGFDGRCCSAAEGARLSELAQARGARAESGYDLAADIWADRPGLPGDPIWLLADQWTGEDAKSKLARVRSELRKAGVDWQILAALDEVAWLFNFRGNDVTNTPVALSFALIGKRKAILYIDPAKVGDEEKRKLGRLAELRPYDRIYEDVRELKGTVAYDPARVNYRLTRELSGPVARLQDPELAMKAVKNDTELANLRLAHLYDGIAVTKFIYWLKKAVREKTITEYDATEYLEGLRRRNKDCLDLSFGSIGAYNANAAMMHYSADKRHAAKLRPEGLYLIDSGGQYLEGTTDITRTIVLGKIPAQWKRDYTLVLKGNIRLSKAKFLEGCTGINLDILARGALWDLGIDYKCGTGHGVGYLLGVHEAPNGFRWKCVPERNDSAPLAAGMVTTIEPGVYIEGSHGIRVENELVLHELEKNEYGQFLGFETITLAPIDREGIDARLLSDDELAFLNDYHKLVYRKLAKYLDKEERAWLKGATKPLRR